MKRAHRYWHLVAWLVLAPLILLVIVLALLARPAAAEAVCNPPAKTNEALT